MKDTITPSEYRTFCEKTYTVPNGANREKHLHLLLIKELGEVASLFAKAMRDEVLRTCTACGGHGYVDISSDDDLNTFAIGQGWKVTVIRASCNNCGSSGRITTYGADAVDRNELMKKLGDVMWCATMLDRNLSLFAMWDAHASEPLELTAWHNPYIATATTEFQRACMLCFEHGFDPHEVAKANVEKFKKQSTHIANVEKLKKQSTHGIHKERE